MPKSICLKKKNEKSNFIAVKKSLLGQTRKFYKRRNNNEVDSIMKGLIVNAYLLPWSDLEKCMYTTLF